MRGGPHLRLAQGAVEVRTLTVEGFRNLDLHRLVLHPRLNLVVGRNGQGKTNLLEALTVVSGRNSFRTADQAALLRDGGGRATVVCSVADGPGESTLGVLLEPGRREHQRDGRKVSRLAASRVLPIVLLTDADLHRLDGPPSERRRALDRAVHALEPSHHAAVSELERLRAARARLLAQPRPDLDETAAFDAAFAKAASRVAAARRRVLPLLSDALSAAAERIGSPFRALSLVLVSDLPAGGSEPELEEGLLELLARRGGEERRAGRPLFGPHRDDLRLLSGGTDVVRRASSGERRTLVLAWSLAERDLLARRTGIPPLLAFDDFDSEWDLDVLSRFLAGLPDTGQLLLTSARPETLRRLPMPDGLVLTLEAGAVQRDPRVRGPQPPEGPSDVFHHS